MNRIYTENNLAVDAIKFEKGSNAIEDLTVQVQQIGEALTFTINGAMTNEAGNYLVCKLFLPRVLFNRIQRHSISSIKDDTTLVVADEFIGIDENDDPKESIVGVSLYEPHNALYINMQMPNDCADSYFYFNYNFTILLSDNIPETV